MAAGLQTFLHMLAHKKVVTESEARESLKAIGSSVATSLPDKPDDVIKLVNKKIACA